MKQLSITDEEMQRIYQTIGKNVKRIRQEKNVSQLKLALAIGHKAVGVISLAELGTKKHFNVEHLVKIADVLEVDLGEFFRDL
ncbi:MAG: helix-turn-helix transcriptional regulator [Campylobacterota bacterium]|nr:helix-turn-helix transcriptional regulator [Campylobacterota bacterium]